MNIRILLADDHEITREGLRSLIDRESDMEVIAEAQDGRTAVQLVAEVDPDVVIMDISMPDLNGVDATRQIKARHPRARVIALSMHSDKQFVTGMLTAGAVGYLLKKSTFEELAHAVRTVSDDHIYLSPAIADIVVKDYMQQLSGNASSGSVELTDREREVLQLLAEGKSTQQISALLHVSASTVSTHRQHIMEKLGMRTVAELTQHALQLGLISLES